MIELILALLIVAAAIYVMYRLATDPAVIVNPSFEEVSAGDNSRAHVETHEQGPADVMEQDHSLEATNTALYE